MVIRSTVDDGSEEQRVFKEPLDGFDEKGREVPCVGEGRGESPGVFEIRVKGRCFREAAQVFEGSWVSRDIPFVRRFQEGDLDSHMRHASVSTPETHVPFPGKALRRNLDQLRPQGPSQASLLAAR